MQPHARGYWTSLRGFVNQELLLQNDYAAVQTIFLKVRLQQGWRLSDGEQATLAEMAGA